MENQAVFLKNAWRVWWKNELLSPPFNSKGAAEAFLDGLRNGRKPS